MHVIRLIVVGVFFVTNWSFANSGCVSFVVEHEGDLNPQPLPPIAEVYGPN